MQRVEGQTSGEEGETEADITAAEIIRLAEFYRSTLSTGRDLLAHQLWDLTMNEWPVIIDQLPFTPAKKQRDAKKAH